MTTSPAAAQHLRDLALLRRVRDRMDRIDREYAQPLDVEALARDVNMSAGHPYGIRDCAVRAPQATWYASKSCAESWREYMTAKKAAQKRATATRKTFNTFTAEERAAMKARARELKDKTDGESAVLAAIAAMPPRDRTIGKRLHELVTASAPSLTPKTWYGMPAYARDGKVVCYFKGAYKFKQRYAQFGFEDAANLDEGAMWPVVFALTKLTPADEKKIAALVRKAVR